MFGFVKNGFRENSDMIQHLSEFLKYNFKTSTRLAKGKNNYVQIWKSPLLLCISGAYSSNSCTTFIEMGQVASSFCLRPWGGFGWPLVQAFLTGKSWTSPMDYLSKEQNGGHYCYTCPPTTLCLIVNVMLQSFRLEVYWKKSVLSRTAFYFRVGYKKVFYNPEQFSPELCVC